MFPCLFMCFSRETGALNRIIDRGSRAISYILTVMVFNIVPTIIEVLTITARSCYCSPIAHIAYDIVVSCFW
jgi:ABC-type transport system involved in Fe-S cluster assembly fused permease/ATPase subunit